MKKRKKQGFYLLLLLLFVMVGCEGTSGKDSGKKQEEITREETQTEETTTQEEAEQTEEETTQWEEQETSQEIQDQEKDQGEVDSVVVEGMSRDIISNMTLEEKVGQMFVFGLDTLRTDGKTKKTKKLTDSMKEILDIYQPGGIFLYSKNMKDQEQTKQLIQDLKDCVRVPLFVATEESVGTQAKIASLSGMEIEEKDEIEKKLSSPLTDDVKEGARGIASYMKELGFQVNFLSVSQQETEEETMDQTKYVEAFLSGMQEGGISTVMCAFPDGTGEYGDTRKGSVDIERTISELRKSEFKIYEAAVKVADFITVGHSSYSMITENQTPASLSKLITTEILRKELRYDGVVITDSMNQKAITDVYSVSEAAVKAVEAGVDMLFYPGATGLEAYEAVLEAVKEGRIEESRVDESVMRILQVKIERGWISLDTDLIK